MPEGILVMELGDVTIVSESEIPRERAGNRLARRSAGSSFLIA